jgi:hypothetical protein
MVPWRESFDAERGGVHLSWEANFSINDDSCAVRVNYRLDFRIEALAPLDSGLGRFRSYRFARKSSW